MTEQLINRQELIDVFLYGHNDMSILGDQELDGKVIDIIRQQPTHKAVPYYEIAQAILKVRGINTGFDCIPREDVINILWRLIDDKKEEPADGQIS